MTYSADKSWRELITDALRDGDTFDKLSFAIADIQELDRKFDAGYGCTEGVPFTAWSDNWVYFPTDYDGSEGVRSVPRHPCNEATEHCGGGG